MRSNYQTFNENLTNEKAKTTLHSLVSQTPALELDNNKKEFTTQSTLYGTFESLNFLKIGSIQNKPSGNNNGCQEETVRNQCNINPRVIGTIDR